ncbi:MAG: pyridoxal phosphate-dependent aminotransferase [Anaerolineae bacterium]
MLARARALESQGREVIHLEIGEPDFDTPAHIVQAGVDALRAGYTHYSPAAGLPELREAVAEHISLSRGIPLSPEQVIVVPGAKPIMFFSILALVEPTDEVIYPNPGFPIYQSMINFVGATPVPLQLREEREFRIDHTELQQLVTDRTKLIIINSPQNPTGGILTREDLEAIAAVARERDLFVLSDEIYNRIIYEGEHLSIATLPDMAERTIILDGFSKTYAMTGWRLGYGVMPNVTLAEAVTRLMVNSNSCTAAFTQMAGVAALKGPDEDVQRMVAAFRRRRDVIVAGLNAIPGLRCQEPKGAFYVFPNVQGTGMDSAAFADYLLDDYGVATLKGESFGEFGRGFIRISYANSVSNIERALDRIDAAVRALS